MFFMFEIFFGLFLSFFFNDTATTEIYTLSLHDALPISAHFMIRARISGVSPGKSCACGASVISGSARPQAAKALNENRNKRREIGRAHV